MTWHVWRCKSCGHGSATPAGKCFGCGALASFVKNAESVNTRTAPVRMSDVVVKEIEHIATGVDALDRGGFYFSYGFSMLVAGDAGLGKSTLLLEAAMRFAGYADHHSIYISSEENQSRVIGRARRCGFPNEERVTFFAESEGERILEVLRRFPYRLCVLDSIQTTSLHGLSMGHVQAEKDMTIALHRWAQEWNAIAIIICQETKDGDAAGPKALEHIVDCNVSFERVNPKYVDASMSHVADRIRTFRVKKNRTGPAPISIHLEMTERGLVAYGGSHE